MKNNEQPTRRTVFLVQYKFAKPMLRPGWHTCSAQSSTMIDALEVLAAAQKSHAQMRAAGSLAKDNVAEYRIVRRTFTDEIVG